MIGPKNGLLYVTTELDKSIAVIDPATLKVIRSIPTDQEESHMLIINHAGTRGYTANVGPGTVSVIDLEAAKVLKVIPICKKHAAHFDLRGRSLGLDRRPNQTATRGDRYLR